MAIAVLVLLCVAGIAVEVTAATVYDCPNCDEHTYHTNGEKNRATLAPQYECDSCGYTGYIEP